MINRHTFDEIRNLLLEFPAVGILGPRQVGKTTLARNLAAQVTAKPIYLDLESPADRSKLSDPESYFVQHKGKLIILDEIQRMPEIFPILRGIIDQRRFEGERAEQFLILGSASLELMQQSSETLAGRIAYKELTGFTADEVTSTDASAGHDRLWLRGGFPDSFLAQSDAASLRWRRNFVSTYLERDIPQIGPRIPAIALRRLWTMLAHNQGGLVNFAQLGANLEIAAPTAKRYLDLLEDLLLIRTLVPWSGNIGKRLVKSPKVYIRDSGLTHALLNLQTVDDVLAHPVTGTSWEGFVIENLLACLPDGINVGFYRSAAGAEIDLVVEKNMQTKYAIEIKRSLAPKVSKGFYLACDDIGATERFIVYPGNEAYSIAPNIAVIPLIQIMELLRNMR